MNSDALEEAVYNIEGFSVSIDNSSKNLRDYFLHSYDQKATVSDWKKRFTRRYPGGSISVRTGDGANAHGNMLLSKLRESYTLDSLRLHIDYLNFLVDYYRAQSDEVGSEALDPFKVLGIDADSDFSAIKHAYLSKCREFHEDKLLSYNLPKELMNFATNKMQEVISAFHELQRKYEPQVDGK